MTAELTPYYGQKSIIGEFDAVCKRVSFFGVKVPLYDLLMGFWERKSNHALVAMINRAHPERILELGAGTGHLLGALVKKYPLATYRASDLSSAMLKCTAESLKKVQFNIEANRVQLVKEDARHIQQPDNSYDLVVSSYLLDLLPHEQIMQVLKESHRVLKPGASAYFMSLTAELVSGRTAVETIAEKYFQLGNAVYEFCYYNKTLREISHAMFGGYYTHCRPINLTERFSEMPGFTVKRTQQSNINIFGIPFLPVKMTEVQKNGQHG